jgi:Reverse transcriptase (RNA-dependent DNA polymerase)/Endonuclease-reverse transcriptase
MHFFLRPLRGTKWSNLLPLISRILNGFSTKQAYLNSSHILKLFLIIGFFQKFFSFGLTIFLAISYEAPGFTIPTPPALPSQQFLRLQKFYGWSQWQLDCYLLRCGDVESNPGPILNNGQWARGQQVRPLPLKVWQWNCRSIRTTRAEFLYRLASEKPDLVLLQETWLREGEAFNVPGYTAFRKDRLVARGGEGQDVRGGGLLTLIRDDQEYRAEHIDQWIPVQQDEETEVLQVKLYWQDSVIVLSNVYALPQLWQVAGEQRQNQFDAGNILTTCVNSDAAAFDLIVGDFNAHHEMWDPRRAIDARGEALADWCADHGVAISNTGAVTYISPTFRGPRSTPDLTLSGPGISVTSWKTLAPMMSDHLPIEFLLDLWGDGTLERPRPPGLRRWTTLARKIPPEKWVEFDVALRGYLREHPLSRRQKRRLKCRYDRLEAALTEAAKVLPRGCRMDPVPWWNEELEDAVNAREELAQHRDDSPEAHEAWKAAAARVAELTKELRTQAWREYASTLRYSTNPEETARVLRQINRDPRPSTTVALTSAAGRPLTSDRATARAFRGVYAKVSAISRNFDDKRPRNVRQEDRERRKRVRDYCGWNRPDVASGVHATPFSLAELEAAIDKMPPKSAPGGDRIPPRMLHNLSHDVKSQVLGLVNMSWKHGRSPSQWRAGIIVPIHKPGKPKNELASYRPICLTSVLAKLAERMVCARLRFHLESQNKLPATQAGSRVGRSTLEPLLRFVGDVHDGFRRSPGLKTLAALIDFSRAFDKVDRWKLMDQFVRLGIPPVYGRWFFTFLMDRRYAVRYGSALSGYVRFALGVPQGTVSGPLLFLIYVSSLAERLQAEGIQTGLRDHAFVDDLTIWARGTTLDALQTTVQRGLDIIADWAREFGMPFSQGKSEAILFSLFHADFLQPIELRLGADVLVLKKCVKLLGVQIDSKLRFDAHVRSLRSDTTVRLKQMLALAGTTWGSSTRDLTSLGQAYIRSKLLYAAPVYFHLLSKSRRKQVEAMDHKTLRIGTGCAHATLTEDLYRQANLPPLSLQVRAMTSAQEEKYRRFPPGDPMRELASGYVPAQIRLGGALSRTWQQVSDSALRASGITPSRRNRRGNARAQHRAVVRQDLQMYSKVAPWRARAAASVSFFPDIGAGGYDRSLGKTALLQRTEQTIRDLQLNWARISGFAAEIWSDGSVQIDSPYAGWGAAHVFISGRRRPLQVAVAAGLNCFAYHAECVAFHAGLQCLYNEIVTGRVPEASLRGKVLLLCTDSQSLVQALQSGPLAQREPLLGAVWEKLVWLVSTVGVGRILVQWVPGHVELPRMAAVDAFAKAQHGIRARDREHEGAPAPFSGVRVALQRSLRQRWDAQTTSDRWQALMGDGRANLRLSGLLSRADETFLAQIQTGMCRSFGPLRYKLDPSLPHRCRWCPAAAAQPEDESPAHLLARCQGAQVRALRATLSGKGVDASKRGAIGKLTKIEEIEAVVDFFRALEHGP